MVVGSGIGAGSGSGMGVGSEEVNQKVILPLDNSMLSVSGRPNVSERSFAFIS